MISISQWAGLATNASPYSIPPGSAAEQINFQAISPGRLESRPGLTSFDTAGSLPIRKMFLYQGAGSRVILCQDSSGVIRKQ
ncbi:MAG: hypothetical protein EB075_07440 [Bacteroidetes bacterium]|jgi:hypothetical protein|nr:hypothetical protein [Bacteroidota bacterium]